MLQMIKKFLSIKKNNKVSVVNGLKVKKLDNGNWGERQIKEMAKLGGRLILM